MENKEVFKQFLENLPHARYLLFRSIVFDAMKISNTTWIRWERGACLPIFLHRAKLNEISRAVFECEIFNN